MADKGMQRQLRAIFSADVKGYSKLMGDDDESTINTITSCREIIIEIIRRYRGRVVDSPGDNILAEFSGALNAVNSAVDIQKKAIRLDPNTPVNFLNHLAWAHTSLAQYEKAVALWNKAVEKKILIIFPLIKVSRLHISFWETRIGPENALQRFYG